MSTIVTYQVSAAWDDGYSYADNSVFDNTNTTVRLGNFFGASNGFFRFTNIAVPKSATIISAKLTLKSDGDRSTSTCSVKIYGNATDNAINPTNCATYNEKVLTTANVSWTIDTWTVESNYDSPDIKNIIQEIVNRSGWSSGNAILLLVKDNGSSAQALRAPYSYDGSTSKVAKLVIEYAPPSTGSTIYLGNTQCTLYLGSTQISINP